ncbi:MAG: hypothetical protein OQJ84_12520 [Xanthomonadales bacterium]|nr:hypothetical protein [Xanthomonadales bacterium]
MMVVESNWREMKQLAFEAYSREGRMSVQTLEQIVDIGCADGNFDDAEKAVLINIISSLTRADMSDAMWAKVDKLIHKFGLAHDTEASVEKLDDEDNR